MGNTTPLLNPCKLYLNRLKSRRPECPYPACTAQCWPLVTGISGSWAGGRASVLRHSRQLFTLSQNPSPPNTGVNVWGNRHAINPDLTSICYV